MKKVMMLAATLCLAAMCSYPQNSASEGTSTSPRGSHSSRQVHWITLTWKASTSSGLRGYNIYRAEGKHRRLMKVNAEVVSGTSYVDNRVQAGHTYHYVARAVGQRGNEGDCSKLASVTVPSP